MRFRLHFNITSADLFSKDTLPVRFCNLPGSVDDLHLCLLSLQEGISIVLNDK